MPITISDIKIRKPDSVVYQDLVYIASITINNAIVINDIRVYERPNGDYKIKLPNHPISAAHGVQNITTKDREDFYHIRHAILAKIKETETEL